MATGIKFEVNNGRNIFSYCAFSYRFSCICVGFYLFNSTLCRTPLLIHVYWPIRSLCTQRKQNIDVKRQDEATPVTGHEGP
jgi:hypothetical protein